MAVLQGYTAEIHVDGVHLGESSGWTYNPVAEPDIYYVLTNPNEQTLPGVKSATGSVDAFYDPGNAEQQAVIDGFEAATSVSLVLYPSTSTTGAKSWTGTVPITGYTINPSAAPGAPTAFNFTFRGVLTPGTVA